MMGRQYILFIVSIVLVIILVLSSNLNRVSSFALVNSTLDLESTTTKPPNQVVGLVFYGRKRQFSILFRYLQRNLKVNGGVLDKIIFAVRTDNITDLNYLEDIMKQNYSYYERVILTNKNFDSFYSFLKDDDLIFKIDDDIVFIANGTFEKMLKEYEQNNGFILSANVVNHPLLSLAHTRIKAILPFREKEDGKWSLIDKAIEIDKTMVYGIKYQVGTCWWSNGRCAAIAHESFLHHVANDNLDVYDFKRWDFHSEAYGRWSINFILFRGKIINKMPRTGDDEEMISNHLSSMHRRHGYALGSAVVCHFSYNFQKEYLYTTNILDRYDELSKSYFGN